jgi:hypothetical protein
MPKLSIRDFWGKRTEKKALNPDMRDMLLSLDGVYEPKGGEDAGPAADREQPDEAPKQAAK